MKKIVSKFGGTSMADAACMLRSSAVCLQQKSNVIVVSATSGTTNDLILLAETAQNSSWSESESLIQKICQRHLKIAEDLKLRSELLAQLKELFEQLQSMSKGIHLLKECSPKAMDAMMSFGERISSVLFVEALSIQLKENKSPLKAEWFDVRLVLKTDEQYGKAKPLTEKIIELCSKHLSDSRLQETLFVTQGFVGSTLDGFTTTLGRGGSDYTAAILAEGISAEVLEIWTDVAGIATTDPRIVSQAKSIPEISFSEASELATFGAKVLHPATLLPAMRKNIPVFVGSSFAAEARGTWVRKEVQNYPAFRALALRKKQALLTLSTPEMLQTHGFLYKLFEVFNKHKVSIDAITTSEISVSVSVDDVVLQNALLIQDLSAFCDVQIEESLCLVSIIGNQMNHTPGIATKIFQSLEGINVRMICLGASKHNFCFLVNEEDAVASLQKLHYQLLEQN